MTSYLEIECRDPIISRDSRPFGSGQGFRMRSAGWPTPSLVAGSLRTCIAKTANRAFTHETNRQLHEIEVAGLFPLANNQLNLPELYLPAPQDCFFASERGPLPMRPVEHKDACADFPHPNLLPVLVKRDKTEQKTEATDHKPKAAPAWWPLSRYAAWLNGETIAFDSDFLCDPELEERTHVKLNPANGSAEESILFTTAGLPLTHLPRYNAKTEDPFDERFSKGFAEIRLATRVSGQDWAQNAVQTLDAFHPLGGERRLVSLQACGDPKHWACPQELKNSLKQCNRVRMVLATPALFKDGWKPGWLNDELIGKPPGSRVKLKLVGLSSQRWRPVSGWSFSGHQSQKPGPKALRRMVPAGAVYFFEVLEGKTHDLGLSWLGSVSDDRLDKRDGFGLACWGIW